jgi:hypothetical protein
MKGCSGVVITVGLSLALAGAALAADPAKKELHLSDKVIVKATVDAIDHANRMVTLKGPKGNLMTFPVDENVARFDAVEVGDEVTATYYESVALEIRKPGAPPAPDSLAVGAAKFEGAKPGGVSSSQTTTTVTILAIDPEIPAVTVKTSDGRTVSTRVQKKKYLKDVKVGDQVVIVRTEGLMIAVDEEKK